jgi:hypothetical protein
VADKAIITLRSKNMDDVLLNHHFLPILIIIDVFWHASFAIKQGAHVDTQNWQD